MTFKEYMRDLVKKAKKSATILVSGFWVMVATAAENIDSLRDAVDTKYFFYIMMATIALARLRGLSKDVKAKK
jgi:predicted phosphatase